MNIFDFEDQEFGIKGVNKEEIKLLKKRVSVRKISTFKKFCLVFSTFNLPKFPV